MSKFTVDTDIPVPENKVVLRLYPFMQMEIGHSFAFAEVEKRKVMSAAYNVLKKHNRRFRVLGLRIWRVE